MSIPGRVKITAIVDAGAEESVAPPSIASAPTRPSKGSTQGQTFCAADGGVMPNMGEKALVVTPEFSNKDYQMVYQITDVTKPLLSVAKMTDNNLDILFIKDGGYVIDAQSGESEAWFPRQGNLYLMNQWLQEDSADAQADQSFGRQEG